MSSFSAKVLLLLVAVAALWIALACGGSNDDSKSERTAGPTPDHGSPVSSLGLATPRTTKINATAANGNASATPPGGDSSSHTTEVATIISGGPTAIARATQAAAASPRPGLRFVIQGADALRNGGAIVVDARLEGLPTSIAAFNFDIVYNQRIVTLDAPQVDLAKLNMGSRNWQCDLPPASGDVDPDPSIGRARLVCFSFGGEGAPAPQTPLTLAKVTIHGVSRGQAELRFENVGVFGPNARAITVDSHTTTIQIQ